MLKDTPVELVGNDRFEGFGIDIIDELAKLLKFKYNFILHDSNYGGPVDKERKNGSWTYVKVIKNNQVQLWTQYFGPQVRVSS